MSNEHVRNVRRQGLSVLRKGRRTVGRLVGPRLRRARTELQKRAGAGAQDLPEQLAFANSEVDRLRSLVHKERREVKRWKAEARDTRISVMDPLPTLALPETVTESIARTRAEHLTYLSERELTVLARQVRDADLSGREGLIIEAGTARGGSAIVMASAKDPARPMKVYDMFGLIPPPSEEDGKDVVKRYETIRSGGAKDPSGETYYGYRDDLLGEVTDAFARLGVPVDQSGVELVKGLFEDTIDLDEPVAFAHLDGDWYESTLTCLERIAPLLVPGGRIVLDDYFFWSGCRKAVDEYFKGRSGYQLERRHKVHVVKL